MFPWHVSLEVLHLHGQVLSPCSIFPFWDQSNRFHLCLHIQSGLFSVQSQGSMPQWAFKKVSPVMALLCGKPISASHCLDSPSYLGDLSSLCSWTWFLIPANVPFHPRSFLAHAFPSAWTSYQIFGFISTTFSGKSSLPFWSRSNCPPPPIISPRVAQTLPLQHVWMLFID